MKLPPPRLMLHLLGDGIFPHVAPASMELQALSGHPVLEVRRPGGKTGNIRKYQQPGLFVRSDKLVNKKKDILTSIWPWRPWRGPGVSRRAAEGSYRRRLVPRRSQSSALPVCVAQSAEKRGVNWRVHPVVAFRSQLIEA